ncbi:MAG TPA: hypothetical protein VMJ70_00905 [Candidatus Sulfotelmatobacter sp.]|nr:hypothetical protein [Candidatus Sulfotelmatobacter sp.]
MRLIRSLSPLALVAALAGTSSAGSLTAPTTALEASMFTITPSVATIVQVPLPQVRPAYEYRPYGYGGYHAYGRMVFVPTSGYIHYSPRPYTPRPYPSTSTHGPATPVPMSILGGFYQPDAGGNNSFDVALRGGPQFDPHVQIGGMAEWSHRSQNQTTLAGNPFTQAGTTITPQRVLASANSDLVPILAFLQLSGGSNMVLVPYAGIAGGYEMLFLNSNDYANNTSYNATFGGWGWQAWGGLGLALSKQLRITGEAFMNQSSPSRNLTALDGTNYREVVNANGTGVRGGLQWGF